MTRRELALLAGAGALPARSAAQITKKKIAAVVTEYRWYSHADVICGRLLGGYSANNIWSPPRTQIVSLWRAQTPRTDMAPDMAARHGFRVAKTMREALTFGRGRVAVDGVVFIGEHGEYPTNADGQKLYPRFELFSELLDVYESLGPAVPTFFDKHFSYDWELARKLFDRSRRLKFPLMAGSSIPVTPRRPYLQPELGTPMTEAVAIGHGPLDAYGFHLLEALQCLLERRKNGENGITEVEWIAGSDIWRWRDSESGSWSKPLFAAAWKRGSLEQAAKDPVLFRLQYKDGLKAAALMLTPSGNDRSVAIAVPGRSEPLFTEFGPELGRPLPHFDGLVACIDDMMVTGKEPYPPERTLLTTGALAFAFESKRARQAVKAPLDITYQVPREVFLQTS